MGYNKVRTNRDFAKRQVRNFDDFLIHDGKKMHVKMNSDVKFDIGLKGIVYIQQTRTNQRFH